MKVLFVHPDLGVGGAERLVVDMALATKLSGNDVTILTNQYDPNHCFEDTKQLNIIVKANSIPRHIAGRFHAFLAYFKILLASVWIVYFSDLKFDVVVGSHVRMKSPNFHSIPHRRHRTMKWSKECTWTTVCCC